MNPRWGSVFAALTEPERLPLPSDEQEKDFLVSHPAKQGNAMSLLEFGTEVKAEI